MQSQDCDDLRHSVCQNTSDTIAETSFVTESGVIILEAEINGVMGRFLFDNGFSQSAVDPGFALKAGKLEDRFPKQNNFEFLPATATISPNLKYSGYLGTDYFDDFLVTINSSENTYRLSLYASSNFSEKELDYGINIYLHEGEWVVFHKNATNTAPMGVNILDKITKIDQFPADHFTDLCQYRDYLHDKKERKEPLTLEIQGQTEPIELLYELPKTVVLE